MFLLFELLRWMAKAAKLMRMCEELVARFTGSHPLSCCLCFGEWVVPFEPSELLFYLFRELC